MRPFAQHMLRSAVAPVIHSLFNPVPVTAQKPESAKDRKNRLARERRVAKKLVSV